MSYPIPRKLSLWRPALVLVCMAGWIQTGFAQIDPEASKAVRAMSDKLAATGNFSFSGTRILDSSLVPMKGTKPDQYQTKILVDVSRPDKFFIKAEGAEDTRQFYFDGKEFTLFDSKANSYGKVLAQSVNIDQMLGHLQTKWGFMPPLSDFIMSDSYKMLMDDVKSGRIVTEPATAISGCKHLAFQQDVVNWELWVSEKDLLPRKLVIVFKQKKGKPQFQFNFEYWSLKPKFTSSTFTYTPAKGAVERELTSLKRK